jgi:phosphopantetheinyl transferase
MNVVWSTDRAVVVSGEPPEDRTKKREFEWTLSRAAARLLPDRRFVSYSHSGRYAAAATGDEPVGVDVQVIRDLDPRAAHLFLTGAEEAALRTCTIAHAMLHFWCAKEAAFKQRLGRTVTLKQTPVHFIGEREDGLRFDVVETFAMGEVIVALTSS